MKYFLNGLTVILSIIFFNARAQEFYEVTKLLASVPGMNSQFGTSVDIEGNRAIVGEPLSDNAYIYEKINGIWVFKKKLNPVWGDGGLFGRSVSIYDSVAVVGCPGESSIDPDMGSVYVFRKNATTWAFEQELMPSNHESGDALGTSVAVYDNTIVIGSPGNDYAGVNAGCSYVFQYNGSSWVETDLLVGSHTDVDDCLGVSVSIIDSVIVVGAPNAYTEKGNVYVFENDGANWNQTAWLGPLGGASYDGFGYSVSVTEGRLVAGAYRSDLIAPNAGCAYIFKKDTLGGGWQHEATLLPSGAGSGQWYGFSVSISGERAVVGSNIGPLGNTVYTFKYDGASWIEIQPIAPEIPESGDMFGTAVSISGNDIIVGALADDEAGNHTGSAYIFSKAFAFLPETNTKQPSLFPNPSNGIVNLNLRSENDFFISILDENMRQLESFKITGSSCLLNFEKYPSGIYFVQISSDSLYTIQKIIHY